MSIYDEIQHRETEGRLSRLRAVLPASEVRKIYINHDVSKLARGPWPDNNAAKRAARVRAILESFIIGDQLVVRLPPSKNVHTVLALLEPADEEAWEFRIGDPKPGVRIFGRFAAKDVFIATSWGYREELDVPKNKKLSDRERAYAIEKKWRDFGIERCKNDWNNLFPTYAPITGTKLHDYLSNATLPV